MKFKYIILLAIIAISIPSFATADFLTEEDKTIAVAEQLQASTLVVDTLDGMGSAFYIDEHEVITNRHVSNDLKIVFLTDSQGHTCIGDKVYSEVETDLSLLSTNCKGTPLKVTESVKLGQSVIVMGHPRTAKFFLTKGIVSSLRTKYIFHDSFTDSGSSGGPVVNLSGELIGVSVSKVEGTFNMSAAISGKELNAFMKRAKENVK